MRRCCFPVAAYCQILKSGLLFIREEVKSALPKAGGGCGCGCLFLSALSWLRGVPQPLERGALLSFSCFEHHILSLSSLLSLLPLVCAPRRNIRILCSVGPYVCPSTRCRFFSGIETACADRSVERRDLSGQVRRKIRHQMQMIS